MMGDKRRLRGIRDGSNELGVTRFIVSTDREARDGHVVDQASWILEEYRENPVVLWAHDYETPPIGKAISVAVEGGALVAEVEWDMESELGATVARQYADGFLNAVSVGWRSDSITARSKLPTDHPAHNEGGMYFENNHMLEFSAVPVPSDAAALAIRGLPSPNPAHMDLDEIAEWLDATRSPVKLTASDIVEALQDPAVRAEIVGMVWSSEIPPESDWVRELEVEDTDEADGDWWE